GPSGGPRGAHVTLQELRVGVARRGARRPPPARRAHPVARPARRRLAARRARRLPPRGRRPLGAPLRLTHLADTPQRAPAAAHHPRRQPIHALHVRSPEPDSLPLVVTHGWPGSVVEMLDVVGPLADPRRHGGDPADAFHVVVPSLPGFGFSTPLRETGWGHARIARAWAELMTRLGYQRFGAMGGDTGSIVSPELGRLAPDRVVGVHVHGGLTRPALLPDDVAALTPRERERLAV